MSSDEVHVGFWTTITEGRSDWVLTLEDDRAFAVLSALAVLLTVTFAYLWNLVRWLILEYLLSSVQADENLRHSGPAATLWWSVQKAKKETPRFSFLVVASVVGILMMTSVAVSILLPWILTDRGSETVIVLANKKYCHMWIPSFDALISTITRNLNLTLEASDYHQTCYQEHTPFRCQSNLMSSRISWNSTAVECPFAPEVCFQNKSAIGWETMRLETQPISMDNLGINTRLPLTFKRALTCSVLNVTAYEKPVVEPESMLLLNLSFGSDWSYEHYVYNLSIAAPGYRIKGLSHPKSIDGGVMDLSLQTNDSYTTIIILEAPGVNFPRPIDDAMFSAHQGDDYRTSGLQTLADYPASVAACLDQYCVYEGDASSCTEWYSTEDGLLQTPSRLENEELLVRSILSYSASSTSVYHTIAGRGSSALTVQRYLNGQTQETIPDDPWHRELEAWFGIALAKMQLAVVSMALESPHLSTDGFLNYLDQNPDMKDICGMIKFRNGNYSNVNGIGLVVTMGVCIILLFIISVVELLNQVSRSNIHTTKH